MAIFSIFSIFQASSSVLYDKKLLFKFLGINVSCTLDLCHIVPCRIYKFGVRFYYITIVQKIVRAHHALISEYQQRTNKHFMHYWKCIAPASEHNDKN